LPAAPPSRGLRATAIVCAVVVSLSALTGCTVNLGGTAVNNGITHDSMTHDMAEPVIPQLVTPETKSAKFSSADIMFAQMMIPHHQQAVDMGTLAETRASNPVVKALAAQIKAEQAPEISQMKAWLETAGASMTMGHHMAMDGMLDSAALAKLEGSKGAAFDKLYLEGMIGHHMGAIEMAKTVVDSNNAVVKKFAETIVGTQTEQINYMRSFLKK